jgi:hypothetical protein
MLPKALCCDNHALEFLERLIDGCGRIGAHRMSYMIGARLFDGATDGVAIPFPADRLMLDVQPDDAAAATQESEE